MITSGVLFITGAPSLTMDHKDRGCDRTPGPERRDLAREWERRTECMEKRKKEAVTRRRDPGRSFGPPRTKGRPAAGEGHLIRGGAATSDPCPGAFSPTR